RPALAQRRYPARSIPCTHVAIAVTSVGFVLIAIPIMIRKSVWVGLWLSCCGPLAAQAAYYVGGLAGISNLSADGRPLFSSNSTSTSLYKPENGPLLNLFGGVDWNSFLSTQVNYIWNRNDVSFSALSVSEQGAAAYQDLRTSRQQAVIGDVLL